MSLKKFTYSDQLRVDQPSIEKVFAQNESVHGKGLFFLYRTNHLDHARMVFILSKKKARTACLRNQIKRYGREMIRLNQYDLPAVDIVVLPNKAISQATRSDIRECFQKLCNHLKRH